MGGLRVHWAVNNRKSRCFKWRRPLNYVKALHCVFRWLCRMNSTLLTLGSGYVGAIHAAISVRKPHERRLADLPSKFRFNSVRLCKGVRSPRVKWTPSTNETGGPRKVIFVANESCR